MDFNYKDILAPIILRFNIAVEKFLRDIQKKMGDPEIQFELFDTGINSDGFIEKISLFKVEDKDRKLRLDVFPKIDGYFECVITDTAVEKPTKWKTNQDNFWNDINHGYSFIENFFKMELVFQDVDRKVLN